MWAEFTQGVHLDGDSVSLALGDLVRADVGRRRRAAGATEAASARRAVLALEDAKELAASLTALTVRLESLAKWERKPRVVTRNPAAISDPGAAPYLNLQGSGVDEHGVPWQRQQPTPPPPSERWEDNPPTPEQLAEWKRKAAERSAAGDVRQPLADIPEWEE